MTDCHLVIKNIRPGSTLGIFEVDETGLIPELSKSPPIYRDVVFWDRIDVKVHTNIDVLIRVRTSRLRIAIPRMPFEEMLTIDGDTEINVFNVEDALLKDLIPIPQVYDLQILGGLLEWAQTVYDEVKLDPLTPYVIMINTIGLICFDNNNVQIINKESKINFLLADPKLFDRIEEFLKV